MRRPSSATGDRVRFSRAIVDASVAIKWVVEETGTPHAVVVRSAYDKLLAPDLLVSECANVLWKKVVRGELTGEEARFAARLLAASDIELVATRAFLEQATMLAIQLNHPAYDCTYLALAIAQNCIFITADVSFVRKIGLLGTPELRESVLLLGADAKE